MKVIDIIPIIDGCLYSVKYEDKYESEFDRLIELWTDTEYVDEYFETNKKYLYTEFWMQRDGLALKNRIPEQAEYFEDKILELGEILNPDDNDEERSLDEFFQPLDNLVYERMEYELSKGKNEDQSFCLRLYAVRLHSQQYVITGGAIKLTFKMKDHPDTKLELQKLNMVKEYLLDQFDHAFTPDLREL